MVLLAALERPDVDLVTEAITEVRPEGVVTADGVLDRQAAGALEPRGQGLAAAHLEHRVEVVAVAARQYEARTLRWATRCRVPLRASVAEQHLLEQAAIGGLELGHDRLPVDRSLAQVMKEKPSHQTPAVARQIRTARLVEMPKDS